LQYVQYIEFTNFHINSSIFLFDEIAERFLSLAPVRDWTDGEAYPTINNPKNGLFKYPVQIDE